MSGCGPRQFACFRIALGGYLAVLFATSAPYAHEALGPDSLASIAGPRSAATGLGFPNVLDAGWVSSPAWFLWLAAALSLLLACGIWRRPASLLVWYAWACIFHSNVRFSDPSTFTIGWLLLACALVPHGEAWSLVPRTRAAAAPAERGAEARAGAAGTSGWQMPPILWIGAWIIMAIGYSLSGLDKLNTYGWPRGEALRYVASFPYARDNLVTSLLLGVPALTKLLTYGILALELLFAPLALVGTTRALAWLGATGMHLGILATCEFPSLTLGVLLMHGFTFDARWLTRDWWPGGRSTAPSASAAAAQASGA